MNETNLTINDQTQQIVASSLQLVSDRTGLYIALFLLFLLFILISYLMYSFLSLKHNPSQQNKHQSNSVDNNLNNRIIFDDKNDLINNNGEIILGQSSFSDCGASLRSSSIRSHINRRTKRSSSYRLCSQGSNYPLTPYLSSQSIVNDDESSPTTIIIEPNDIQSANALSRSISKYYERKRKPKLKQRTHSCDDITIRVQTKVRRPLQATTSLRIRRSFQQIDKNSRKNQTQTSQTSFKRKPTTIYELYRSNKMRVANLLVSDSRTSQ